MKAEVILMKCPEAGRPYGVRAEERYGDWFRTWAFPIDEKRARSEGFDRNEVKGSLDAADEYNGCPYCGAKKFVVCGRCGKLSCWNKEERITCAWCGLTGNVETTTGDVSVKGGGY